MQKSPPLLPWSAARSFLIPGDLDTVKKIQAGYRTASIVEYLGKPGAPACAEVKWIKRWLPAEQSKSLEFLNQLAFLLQLTSVNPGDATLRKRFESIGMYRQGRSILRHCRCQKDGLF